MTNEQATPLGESGDASPAPASDLAETGVSDGDAGASAGRGIEHVLRTRLPEELNAALESPDPVAGLDNAIQTIAAELSRDSTPDAGRKGLAGPGEEMTGAIETLVRVALEMDDPVSALEEGAESLAEALAERDHAEQAWQRAAEEKRADHQAAYQHARFHRVGELVDAGYSLDHAVAITNENEADIRAMATRTGNDPMDAIYRYAILNGYRGSRSPAPRATSARPANVDTDLSRNLATLAQLSDEAFAEATSGDRWRELMRRQV